ncbi:hypothetical protein [cf. Phormidesmis sp. LEGE 11477]|uniref:hypothetical protein n=1 Tax=cf. Phormidesmis sp. LEGE 11477 TaxID=1828680 RepID=UPI001880B826|nr:hypothetical protein [cf. Phormidesmis sp. LEGE 11477]MBE9060744.1 hypothetical protein [cf. Phormidesmis sp. LEGE 11477]
MKLLIAIVIRRLFPLDMSIQDSWNLTRRHLDSASACLPAALVPGEDGGTLARYRNWLEHNELEFALDELIDLGDANPVPVNFWHNLLDAAYNMGLAKQSVEIEYRIDL